MTNADYATLTYYRFTAGLESTTVDPALAQAAYDEHPAALRSGRRDGAFILWSLDRLGRRCAPVICRPIRRK